MAKIKIDYREILELASAEVKNLKGHTIDILTINKPPDVGYAGHLAKVISKLSPLIGNMLEFSLVSFLNALDHWKGLGQWERQDPGFPDTIFVGIKPPSPGIEIKTWFPLATEITARFKDSYSHFSEGQTNVALVAWLPENILFGRILVLDVWVDSAKSLAEARDTHYHNPPDYLIFEPEDTSARTANLQQTNTNGYKFQGTTKQFRDAEKIVKSWGKEGKNYHHAIEYQNKLKGLLGKFPYRLDTNFAKIDRIKHKGLEKFKESVLKRMFKGKTVLEWSKLINSKNELEIESLMNKLIT